jgi:hypothetical protein
MALSTMICILGCGEANVEYDCKNDVYYNLTEDERNKIPYKERDTLIYLSNIGDTAIVYGEISNSHYYRKEGGGGNCPVWGTYAEYRVFIFISENNELDSIRLNWSVNMNNLERNFFVNNQRLLINNINNTNSYTDTITYKGNIVKGMPIHQNHDRFKYYLYNYNYGLLRIVTTNNKTWTLIN